MKCENCGTEFNSQEKFCPQCGTPRHHQLPSLNRVQSSSTAGQEAYHPEPENGKAGMPAFQRTLVPALIVIATMALMVLLYLAFFR